MEEYREYKVKPGIHPIHNILNLNDYKELLPITTHMFNVITRHDRKDIIFNLKINHATSGEADHIRINISVSAYYFPNEHRSFKELHDNVLIKDIMDYGFEVPKNISLKEQLNVYNESDMHIAGSMVVLAMKGIEYLDWNNIITGDAPIDMYDKRIPNKDFK